MLKVKDKAPMDVALVSLLLVLNRYSEHCQASEMELFIKMINGF